MKENDCIYGEKFSDGWHCMGQKDTPPCFGKCGDYIGRPSSITKEDRALNLIHNLSDPQKDPQCPNWVLQEVMRYLYG